MKGLLTTDTFSVSVIWYYCTRFRGKKGLKCLCVKTNSLLELCLSWTFPIAGNPQKLLNLWWNIAAAELLRKENHLLFFSSES